MVEAFNEEEKEVIAKKTLSNHNFVTSKYNRGAAARRGVERHALPVRLSTATKRYTSFKRRMKMPRDTIKNRRIKFYARHFALTLLKGKPVHSQAMLA